MGKNVPTQIVNNSRRNISIVVFQTVRSPDNREELRIVFSGFIYSQSSARFQMDESITPLACLSEKRYEAGNLFVRSQGDRDVRLTHQPPMRGEQCYAIEERDL